MVRSLGKKQVDLSSLKEMKSLFDRCQSDVNPKNRVYFYAEAVKLRDAIEAAFGSLVIQAYYLGLGLEYKA